MDKKGGVKQNILESALELFSAKGYEGVAVSELTAAAGITKPTLYYYFGSKKGLFEAVCKENYSRLDRAVAAGAVYHANPENYREDVNKTLRNAAFAYFSFAFENEAFYRLAMANLYLPRSSEVFDIVKQYHFKQYEIIGGMFADMANAHGNMRNKDKQLAWSFIGAVNAYVGLSFNSAENPPPAEDTIREFIHRFMHGIFA